MVKTLVLWCRRFLFITWCGCLLLFGMWVLYENNTPVTVNYLDVWQREQSLGVVIFEMLLVGFGLGLLTNTLSAKLSVFRHKRKYLRAHRELEKLKRIRLQE